MAPKLSTLVDAFTAPTINTALWNNISTGTATLDTTNDLLSLAVPTASGGTNTFGEGAPYDATSSALYAQVGVPPNGNGGTKVAYKLLVDASNSVAFRVESGVFKFTLQTAGATVVTTLPTYDPDAHRWWRLREAAGTWFGEASADGYNWAVLASSAYSWAASATAMTFAFQAGASVAEVAGSVATISHVNTMLGGPANPNWPTVEDAWGPLWSANGGEIPTDRYVSVTDRTRGNVGVNRGRQYETDQVRSGEASLTLANPDGALDPGNATGPWAGHVLPYQPYRRRAMWPPSRNLLTQVQASGGDGLAPGSISSAGIGVFSSADSSGGQIVADATAYQGGNVFAFAVPTSTGSGSRIGYANQVAVTPGQTYTVQLRVRDVTASTSVSVKAHIAYYGPTPGASPTTFVYGSTVVLTGSATAPWSLVSVTVTVPASVYGVSVGVSTAATVAAACSVQVDGWQLEKGSVASTWTYPGIWNPIYAGFTERWPSSWNMSGTYGVVSPTGVDAFSLLSQQQLSDALTQEINNNNPRWLFKLDDPSGSTSVADATGNYPAAPLGIAKDGAGSLTFGNAITSASSTGAYTGSAGTVVTINNPNPGTSPFAPSTFLSLDRAGIHGPAAPSVSWSRMLAFRYTGPTPTFLAYLWSSMNAGGSSDTSQLYWAINTSGQFIAQMSGPSSPALLIFNTGVNVADANWHLAIFSYSHANATFIINLDGISLMWSSVDPTLEPTGLISDSLGAFVNTQIGNYSRGNYKGDISYAAEFPTNLSPTAMTNIYTAWRSACAGESTAARYSRILRYSGYSGPSSIQTGLTTSMGPANIDGQDAVSALQAVVDTEGGAHYVSRDGTITFRSRSTRYNATVPTYTFGERADLGEWPYEDCQLDFDSTHLSNSVTVTQEGTSQAFYATDATSTTAYFPRTMTRTINSSSALECQDAANYLLSRYRQPATRVSSIKLHPSAQPAMWPVCLALELGTRVRVMRRPPNAPVAQIDCFVENIQWDMADTGEATVTLQCSPVDLTPYGVFSAWHTTLATTIASGVATITVTASADNTNPLAAQLASGDQIVLGQNTANQETVTVSAVGATSAGWTTAVITLTANTTKSHTAGDIVCEPLPAGVTDPTTWDAVSRFDSVAFSY